MTCPPTREGTLALVAYVVSRFEERFGEGVGRARLTKLLFLIDALHAERHGCQATTLRWERWYFGPHARELPDLLDELYEGRSVDFAPSHVAVRVVADAEPPAGVPREARVVADEVVEKYGGLPMEVLLEAASRMVAGTPLGGRIRLAQPDRTDARA